MNSQLLISKTMKEAFKQQADPGFKGAKFKEERFMCRFVKIFFKGVLGLTSAMNLLMPLQVQAVGYEIKPGAILLAQNTAPQKEPQKSPAPACGQEEEKLKQEKLMAGTEAP